MPYSVVKHPSWLPSGDQQSRLVTVKETKLLNESRSDRIIESAYVGYNEIPDSFIPALNPGSQIFCIPLVS